LFYAGPASDTVIFVKWLNPKHLAAAASGADLLRLQVEVDCSYSSHPPGKPAPKGS
jgi:hypothetical protein